MAQRCAPHDEQTPVYSSKSNNPRKSSPQSQTRETGSPMTSPSPGYHHRQDDDEVTGKLSAKQRVQFADSTSSLPLAVHSSERSDLKSRSMTMPRSLPPPSTERAWDLLASKTNIHIIQESCRPGETPGHRSGITSPREGWSAKRRYCTTLPLSTKRCNPPGVFLAGFLWPNSKSEASISRHATSSSGWRQDATGLWQVKVFTSTAVSSDIRMESGKG